MMYNAYLSKNCKKTSLCAKTAFINEVCKRANIHTIKLLRLSLKWAWPLLQDDDLDLRIIYLARDPRAVLESRSKVNWCHDKTCKDPKTVCKLLDDDLQEAKKMMQQFPEKFKFIQYEKVSDDLVNSLKDIMAFAGLGVTDRQMKIIGRKKGNPNEPFITRKNSRNQVNRWRKKADFRQIWTFQRECLKPLSQLGLRIFSSKTELVDVSLPLVVSGDKL
ncbi:carbohydrate sulfotransferase 5-like [Macrobrachium nipponense]|uniref:carbohydrate sulfotransferase 5-like n=1 Tax=Macrobrachium nipponense TaxID=159736 RepID=UPI0030C81B69